MSLAPVWPLDEPVPSMTPDLANLVRESHREVMAALDDLIDGNIANPAALLLARLTLPQQLYLALALVPAGSLDHVVAGAIALHRLNEGLGRGARTGHQVMALLRLVEDAEPAARADFEREPLATRLERVTSFLCAELRDWDQSASEPGPIPACQACRHATASAHHRL